MATAADFLRQYAETDLQRFVADSVEFVLKYHRVHLGFVEAWEEGPHRTLTPSEFYAEYVWVVMASGFSSPVVYTYFPRMAKTLCNFDPYKIYANTLSRGMKYFRNRNKWLGIIECATMIRTLGWDEFSRRYLVSDESLKKLPRIRGKSALALATRLRLPHTGDAMRKLCDHFRVSPETVQAHYEAMSFSQTQADYIVWCYLGHCGEAAECCRPKKGDS